MRITMNKSAFSLVEASIVLVVIGLLVGGIIAGRSILKNAELNKMAVQAQGWITSVGQFKSRFRAFPGDMLNATQYWGLAGGTAAPNDVTCYNANTIESTATCNGNGDKQILESYSLWKHLSNAGLSDSRYAGKAIGTPPLMSYCGLSAPLGALEGSCFMLYYMDQSADPCTTTCQNFKFNFGNVLTLGRLGPAAGPYRPLLAPGDAYYMDRKMDDGMPATGAWMGSIATADYLTTATSGIAAASATDTTATYRTSLDTTTINLLIKVPN